MTIASTDHQSAGAGANVAIVGVGHVGAIMALQFPGARLFDKFNAAHAATRDEVSARRFAFVCVPTPESPDGSADLSALHEAVDWIKSEIVVIRSTVPPGTTERLRTATGKRIVFWPEYIGEWKHPVPWEQSPDGWPAVILGGDRADTRAVATLVSSRFGAAKTYWQTTATTAELCKYMENAWLATQVTFANQFKLIADSLDVDYTELRELFLTDPRISRTHTVVMDGSPGFGGRCLPKDLAAIIATSRAAGVDAGLLEAVQNFNSMLRSPSGASVPALSVSAPPVGDRDPID
jgi:UDPglucose 6-dehydrogenase